MCEWTDFLSFVTELKEGSFSKLKVRDHPKLCQIFFDDTERVSIGFLNRKESDKCFVFYFNLGEEYNTLSDAINYVEERVPCYYVMK